MIDPAIYNGSIHLPLRAIGEIMGKNVSWDSATQTVRIDSATADSDVNDFDTNNSSQTIPVASVTLEQAKQTALKHAGKTAAQVRFVKAQQDWEHGHMVYEIEFIVNNETGYMEYDYEIDIITGNIISYDYDAENYIFNPNNNYNATVKISEKAAKQAALARVPSATERNIIKFELEYDDGRWKYEGEIRYGSYEYDFTIDANTGVFLEWDVEFSN